MSNRTPTNHPKTFMRLKPQTRPKVEAVARLKRWTLAETADAVFDDYLSRHGIAVGKKLAGVGAADAGEATARSR
jgi:hypothetical protein